MQGFRLDQTFFGFDASDRVAMHDNIFNIIWWGEGRWSWDDIYYMPVFLRRYWQQRINKIIEDREAAIEEAQESVKNSKTRRKRSS